MYEGEFNDLDGLGLLWELGGFVVHRLLLVCILYRIVIL